jgi:hypothetical protein
MPCEPDPQYWRDRAKNLRAKAEHVKDPRSKRMMLGIAKAYERIANRVTQRLRDTKKSK